MSHQKPKAVAYNRVSTDYQAESGYSLPAQKKDCQAFAKNQGYDIVRFFVDGGESAKNTDRTQFNQMQEFIKNPANKIEAVILGDLDRLARVARDFFNIRFTLGESGIKLLFVRGPDASTPEGKMMQGITAVLAEYENDIKSRRVSIGMRQALEEGRWQGKAPVGYTLEVTIKGKSQLTPDPKTAPFIKKMFTLMNTGKYSQADVCRILTEKGFRISPQNLEKRLKKPVYAGIIENKLLDHPVIGEHEPLISREVFDNVQKIIAQGRTHAARRPKNTRLPLKQIIQCGVCGGKYTGAPSKGNGGKYPYYRCQKNCQKSTPQKEIEDKLKRLLSEFCPSNPEIAFFRTIVEKEWKDHRKNALSEEKSLQKQIEKIESNRMDLLQGKIDKIISDENYMKMEARYSEELLTKKEMLQSILNKLSNEQESLLEQAEYCYQHLDLLWVKASYEDKIELIHILFNGILIYNRPELTAPKASITMRGMHHITRPGETTIRDRVKPATDNDDDSKGEIS